MDGKRLMRFHIYPDLCGWDLGAQNGLALYVPGKLRKCRLRDDSFHPSQAELPGLFPAL